MISLYTKLKRVRPLLGTYVEITLGAAVGENELNAWITAGFEAVEQIDRLMSLHRPDSDLSRLNRARPAEWVNMHPHTLNVLKISNELFYASRGVFDIRCAAVRPECTAPLEFHGTRARKTGPWTLDLSGIAKGYAVDCSVEKMKTISAGYQASGVVNAGGDLRRWGAGAEPIAVATSAVRTPDIRERLSPARHVLMPQGKILRRRKAVAVASDRCVVSDALTKVMLLAPKGVADRCLKRFEAHGWRL